MAGRVPPQLDNQALMYQGSVQEPRYQRPGLLWIPLPVTSPGLFGPDGTTDDSKGKQEETRGNTVMVEPIQGIKTRQPAEKKA